MAFTNFRWHRRYLRPCDAWITVAEDLDTGVIWWPVRPVCLALQVDSSSQIERIKSDWRLAPGLHPIPIPTEQRTDGTWARAQPNQCLPFDELAWWMGGVDPRNATPQVREKLLQRQRALMEFARHIMRQDDAGVERASRGLERAQSDTAEPSTVIATGEIHTHCPVCHAPLCVVIAGAHVVAGVEVE